MPIILAEASGDGTIFTAIVSVASTLATTFGSYLAWRLARQKLRPKESLTETDLLLRREEASQAATDYLVKKHQEIISKLERQLSRIHSEVDRLQEERLKYLVEIDLLSDRLEAATQENKALKSKVPPNAT